VVGAPPAGAYSAPPDPVAGGWVPRTPPSLLAFGLEFASGVPPKDIGSMSITIPIPGKLQHKTHAFNGCKLILLTHSILHRNYIWFNNTVLLQPVKKLNEMIKVETLDCERFRFPVKVEKHCHISTVNHRYYSPCTAEPVSHCKHFYIRY